MLPAWVADMDLGIPESVTAALRQTIDRQDLGYPYWPDGDPVVHAFEERMRSRYGWFPASHRTRVFSDLIQILQIVIEYATAPGDAVAIQVPNYPPFLAAIHRAGRRIVALPLGENHAGWSFEIERYRAIFAEQSPRLLVLVNPHNPTGRVWTRPELTSLAELATHHGTLVLADEIHADLTYAPRHHIPFASLSPDVESLTITTTSATKAFNLAGTRCAVAHFGHRPTAEALDRAPLDYFGTPSVLSRVATVAAWQHGDPWLQDTIALLRRNRDRVQQWAADRPGIKHHTPEATYLSWLDFGATRLAADPAAAIVDRGRVQLSPGRDFAQHTALDTSRFARLNFATSPEVLEAILNRTDTALSM
ncbi:MalY/PatB family protein [Mycobacterium sp. NPDC003323]